MKLNDWSRLVLIAVCIVSALAAFNLPDKYDAMAKYLLHVKLLSLSFLALGLFGFLSVLYNSVLCIGSGLVVVMILNWFISSWFFNPFEMGANQIVMGWVLSFLLVIIPIIIAVKNNIQKRIKRQKYLKCKRDAAAKYISMKQQAAEMKKINEELSKEIFEIKEKLRLQ